MQSAIIARLVTVCCLITCYDFRTSSAWPVRTPGRTSVRPTRHLLHNGLMDNRPLMRSRQAMLPSLRAPTPFRIQRPQRDVREHHDRPIALQMLDVIFHPLRLFGSR
jgi:hypothetical protein